MSEFKYEIGDQFKALGGGTFKVRDRVAGASENWYWLTATHGNPRTLSEVGLDQLQKIEPFFEVGDMFESPYRDYETMTVTHLDEEGLRSAWVTVCSDDEVTRKETIGVATWRLVKDEILRNRSN